MGQPTHGVAIFAEALGEDEAKFSTPLVGRAGGTFNRMLTRTIDPLTNTPLRREDFLLGNIINCRPPNNVFTKAPYEDEAIRRCTPYLKETLAKWKPKVIFTMGNQPLRRFTGEWGIDRLRGYIFKTPMGLVVPSYHPSYIQRGKWQYARVWQLDLLKALHVAREGIPTVEKRYITHPTVGDVEAWIQRYFEAGCPPLSMDIETLHPKELSESEEKDEEWIPEFTTIEDDPSYTILRISFSYEGFTAISFPWVGGFIPLAKLLLEAARVIIGWNVRRFDIPRLENAGVTFNCRVYDGMDLWHFLEPALRMGLAYVATFLCPDMEAWKLQSRTSPEWYSCVDADVALRCFLSMKERAIREGRWDSYEHHVVDLLEVLRGATARGIAVDVDLRRRYREGFEQELDEVAASIQPLVPREVKPRKVFKKSEESLKKQKPGKDGPAWEEGKMYRVKEELSEKEVAALLKKEARAAEKEAREAAKRERALERKRARELKRSLKESQKAAAGSSSKTRKKKSRSSKKSSPE